MCGCHCVCAFKCLSLCVYLSMMAVHVSVKRGWAGGVWLAVTLILQRPWKHIIRSTLQSTHIWLEFLPHTDRYRLKDTSSFKHKQLQNGWKNPFHMEEEIIRKDNVVVNLSELLKTIVITNRSSLFMISMFAFPYFSGQVIMPCNFPLIFCNPSSPSSMPVQCFYFRLRWI